MQSRWTRARAGPGVADHVGQRLRHDPVGRHLHGRGERAEVGGVHLDRQRLGLRKLSDRADEPSVVERRWPQLVHEAAYVGDDVLYLPAHLGEHRLGPLGLRSTSSRAVSSW